MILASDSQSALEAEKAGVDRIFFDLEYINKIERQSGRNTVISNNNIEDIPKVKRVLSKSQLLVRTNPIHAYSKDEIDKAIHYGADILMLPMVVDQHDAANYINYVKGRAKVCIMIETAQALSRIDKIIEVDGVDEIFIGLNDLHISLGLTFMFETLNGGLVEYIAEKCNRKGIPFGFGGIARVGDGLLPADYILGEHLRLGSSSVILSRTFKGEIEGNSQDVFLEKEVKKVRDRIIEIKNWTNEDFELNKKRVDESVDLIVKKITPTHV